MHNINRITHEPHHRSIACDADVDKWVISHRSPGFAVITDKKTHTKATTLRYWLSLNVEEDEKLTSGTLPPEAIVGRIPWSNPSKNSWLNLWRNSYRNAWRKLLKKMLQGMQWRKLQGAAEKNAKSSRHYYTLNMGYIWLFFHDSVSVNVYILALKNKNEHIWCLTCDNVGLISGYQ